MAMEWLKGLVGSTDGMIPAGQAIPSYQYGAPQYGAPQYGAPQPGAPPAGGATPVPQAWAPQPAAGPAATPPMSPTPAWGAPPGAAAPLPPEARIAALEARCVELHRDVESIALFARTLLTMLQEKQIVTPQQFQETKQKLDMLDGKLDDRIAPGA
jgi:hypothetical protein